MIVAPCLFILASIEVDGEAISTDAVGIESVEVVVAVAIDVLFSLMMNR